MAKFEVRITNMDRNTMEDYKRKDTAGTADKEIVFSQTVKAGKRIYYLDVKRNRKDELFLAITESKRKSGGDEGDAQVSFEKHKIFLYHEDFDKFMQSLNTAVNYIKESQPETETFRYSRDNDGDKPKAEDNTYSHDTDSSDSGSGDDIKIDIEF